MQKVINVLAVLSFVGTAGIVGGGAATTFTGAGRARRSLADVWRARRSLADAWRRRAA